MFMKSKIFVLFSLLYLTLHLNLIREKNTPLYIENPFYTLNSQFSLRFSFPSGSNEDVGLNSISSPGLSYKQFFGVKFPTSMGAQLQFNKWEDPKFECTLSDGTKSYQVTAVTAAQNNLDNLQLIESSTAYCRLDEPAVNLPLKVGMSIVYTLKISLLIPVSTNFINNISLFTATSNDANKIIIDYLPVFGNALLYNNPADFASTKPIDFVSANIDIENGVPSASFGYELIPNYNFNFKVQLIVNDFISLADYIIVFKYPAKTVSPGNSISSLPVDQSVNNQQALNGSLTLNRIGTDSLFLDGIKEDFTPGRQFILNFSGWTALDTDVGTTRPFELLLYYKNTYTICSYSSINLFTVESTKLTVTANHPEFWDIFRNAAWPMSFTFTSPNNLLGSQYFVVIQHDNALLSSMNDGNIVTFVASTCDFSGNNNFDSTIGVRPSCYPLRLDQHYPGENSFNQFSGSGIFFNLPGPINMNQVFNINVWIYADNCGGYKFNNFNGNAFSVPEFTISIYSNINPNEINEKRFDPNNPNIQLIAQGTQSFDGKCWNNKIADFNPTNMSDVKSDNYFQLDYNNDDSFKGANKKFTVKFREIFNWKTTSQLQNACTNCFDNDISTGTFSENFIYSTNNNLTNGSYFLAYTKFNSIGNTLWTILPSGVMNKDPSANNPGNINGKLTVLFSKSWFTGSKNYLFYSKAPCYLSWACSSGNSNLKKLSKNITVPSPGMNYITAKRGPNASKSEFDELNTNLIPNSTVNSRSNIMKLVSQFYVDGGLNTWDYLENISTNGKFGFAWFTNCITWNLNANNSIKSLFTYIDVQYQWTYTEKSTNTPDKYRIYSNVRLVKLFPEGGVFHDFNKFPSNANNANPYISHFVMAQSSNYSPVCLIEIDGASIQNVSTSDSNSFILFLGLSSILETDYLNTSATYPVAPLVSTAEVYGLQSQNPFHDQNLYVSDDYISNGYPNYLLPPMFRALWSIQNDQSITGTYGQVNRGSNQSIYHFLLGSVLVFTGLNTGSLQGGNNSPLFIPYYCNYAKENSNNDNRVVLNLPPTLFGAWTTINSYDSISSFNSFLTYTIDSTNNFSLLTSANNLNQPNDVPYGAYKGYNAGNLSGTQIYTSQYTATLAWNAYTDNDTGLNVYNANRMNTNNVNVKCTGYSFFLSNIISINNQLVINNNAHLDNGTFQSSSFYVMGKKFSQAIFVGGLALIDVALNDVKIPNIMNGQPLIIVDGIKRPTIESFIQNGELVVSDKVAFSCVSAITNYYDALTNYFYTDIGQTSLVLDFTFSSSNWSGSIGFDKSDVSQHDHAGNLQITVTTPTTIPINSTIYVGSTNNFNSNTICGIVIDENLNVNECIKSSGIFGCQIPVTGTDFNICCYNIYLGSPIVLSELSADLNTEPNNYDLSGYLLNTMYSADLQLRSANNLFQFNPNSNSIPDIIGSKYAYISDVSYSHVSSEGGIGKILFTIQLPREPTRDMMVSIIGDFTGLLVPGKGNNPRCVASFNEQFGSSWDNGDILIDSCSTNNISDGIPVIIKTRKMIYKCGISFSKVLFISLWPVNVVNWNNSLKNNFYISMQLNSLDPIALNSQSVSIPLPVNVSKQTNFIGQWDTLCPVVSVTPRIPSEIADYTFEFDLDTNKGALLGSILNEISIFWPYQFYGSNLNNLVCCYLNVLNCYFDDEGILNIQLPQSLRIGTGNKIQITVSGVPNPEINFDYSFPCTLNFIDRLMNTRSNIITGSGKMLGGITNNNISSEGGLRFMNIVKPTSNSNPRNTSTHTFRITFDETYGLSSLPLSIDNPIINIYFPDEYNLSWYINIPSATINEYTINSGIISQTSTYLPYDVIQSGQKVSVIIGSNVTFGINFKYWEIVLTNIVNPINPTISPGSPISQSTGPFRITLTNSEETIYYSVFSNSNSYSNTLLPDSLITNIMWSRGNIFQYDSSQNVVDFYSDPAILNKITVRAGRYSTAFMNIEPNSNLNLPLVTTTISLVDPIFATSEVSYDLPVAYYSPLSFLIGCTCNTKEGHYFVIFNSSETNLFAPLAPVMITVQTTTVASITFQKLSNSAPVAGSQWINYYISEPNFDALNIVWRKVETIYDDETAKLSNAVISPTYSYDTNTGSSTPVARSIFSISTPMPIPFPQSFYTPDPNNCYSFMGANTIGFTTQGATAIVSPENVISTFFEYADSNIDSSLPKNSISFTFSPFVYPVYLYCALACFNNDYPADEDIINPVENNSIFLQFYSNEIDSSNFERIVFNNLIRNQRYKLRCIVQSTESDIELRTSIGESMENLNTTIPDSQTLSQIIPTPPFPTQCLQWNFETDPGNTARSALLKNCQNSFSYSGGWFNNSCVICTDADLILQSPGLYIDRNRIDSIDIPSPTYAQSIQNKNTVTNYTSFTLCPVPHPVCASDGDFLNTFNQFSNNLQTNSQLNLATSQSLQLVNNNSFFIINDSSKPDINSLNVNLINYNDWGIFNLTANFPTPVLCYWKIEGSSGNSTLPSFYEIETCTDISWCGNTVINSIGIEIQNDPVNIRNFALGVTYNVYFACKNYVPFAVYQSDVKMVLNFRIDTGRFISSVKPPSRIFSLKMASDIYTNTNLGFLIMIILLFG